MENSNQFSRVYLFFFPTIIIHLIFGSLLVNSFLVITSIYVFYLVKIKKLEIKKISLIPLALIYLCLNINTLVSTDIFNSLERNFFFFRFLFLTLATIYILENFSNYILNFSKFWLIILLILSFDIMFQGYFGFNIL